MDGPLSVASFVFPDTTNNNRKRTYQDMSLGRHAAYLRPRRISLSPSSSDESSTSLFESSSSSSCQSASSSSNSAPTTTEQILARHPELRARPGFDMRRPAPIIERPASVPQQRDVIDLTEDTRPSPQAPSRSFHRPPTPARVRPPQQQRPSHEVIDLSDGDDMSSGRPQPPSPEIQFIRSRPRSRSASIHPGNSHDQIRDRNRAWLREQIHNVQHGLLRVREQLHPNLTLPPMPFTFGPPDMLDFGAIGFDLDHPHRQPPQAPLPTYTAPPAPQPGYTRSNVELEGLMVCPMCDDELGTGESDMKKQVWVARSCGHVYCGECASKRGSGNHKKKKLPGGSSQRPFSNCVVDKCGKKLAAKKDMLQIFL